MKKILGCVFIALAIVQLGAAQTRYIVKFRNKGTNPFSLANPSGFLSQRSIDRRNRYSILLDSTDLPVTPRYVDSVKLAGAVTILNVSKWLNSVSIQTTDATALTKINNLTFVQSVTGIAARPSGNTAGKFNSGIQQADGAVADENIDQQAYSLFNMNADYFDYGAAYAQIHLHNGEFLHNIGLRGQNMLISILDAGFQNYLTVKAFDSARANGQIRGVYDFVVHDNSVNEDDSHGEECFSTIASNIPGQLVGTAPKSGFYLFRTEDASSEYPIEEHNWVCGAEKADSLGVDLISSSLGYNVFDAPLQAQSHTYTDMNGNTTMVAIGADLAARKGLLVVNSAGNEGANTWHYIITPADGDSVMAVGAVNSSGLVASFSSYGPSSDGQVKPDVAAVGVNAAIEFPGNTIGTNSGTSFACPIMAGITTCLWQGFPEFNNMKIINALRQSGSMASAPDDRIGYGIPDIKKATMNLLKDFGTSSVTVSNCQATVNWTSKDMSAMKYEIERKLPGQTNFVKIAEQQGTGSIFSNHAYTANDALTAANAGIISYRIREIIDTSSSGFTADYIDTAVLSLGSNCNATSVTPVVIDNTVRIIPNPARDQFILKISTPASVPDLVIRIINSKGQLVSLLRKTKGAGDADYIIPIMHLARGKYYVIIYEANRILSTKELIRL